MPRTEPPDVLLTSVGQSLRGKQGQAAKHPSRPSKASSMTSPPSPSTSSGSHHRVTGGVTGH